MSSPVSRIPTELIVEIFLWSTISSLRHQPTSPSSASHLEDTPRFDTTALAISHVCGLWRSLSLMLPAMWSTMKVYDPSAVALTLVELYLFRAGPSTLLSLELIQRTDIIGNASGIQHLRRSQPIDFEIEYTEAIFNLWFAHSERWQSINFDFQACRPPLALVHAFGTRFPKLQDVSVQVNGSMQDYFMLEQFWETIHTLPTLRTTYWQYGHFESAPFGQLTRFTLPRVSVDEAYDVLRQSQQLEHLTIEEFAWRKSTDLMDEPKKEALVLPHLTALHLSNQGDSTGARRLMRIITTPQLNNLELHHIPRDFTKATLSGFLSRSGCSLRSLTLGHSSSGADEQIIKCLRMAEYGGYLNKLERLELKGNFSKNIFQLLKVKYQTSTAAKPEATLRPLGWDVDPSILQLDMHVPFPSLITLKVDSCSELPDGLLGSLLHSRAEEGFQLWRLECKIWVWAWKDIVRGERSFVGKKDENRFRLMEEKFGSSDIKLIYV